MRRLIVALDGVAALREVTGAEEFDCSAAATLAGLSGADAVQLGINEEMRPVRENDVRDVTRSARGLELRFAPVPSLVKVALEARPETVVLASESRERASLASPLDFRAWGTALSPVVRTLREAGLRVFALVAGELDAVKAAHTADLEGVDLYSGTILDLPDSERRAGLERLGDAARLAAKLRLGVGISGGLGMREIDAVLEAAPVASRVTVGRAFVARSLLLGIDRSARDLRARL